LVNRQASKQKNKNMSKTKLISAVLLLMFVLFLVVSSVKHDMSQGQVNTDPVTECYNKCTVSQFVELKNQLAQEEKEKAEKKEQMSKILTESAK
jgi:hypothetical protein